MATSAERNWWRRDNAPVYVMTAILAVLSVVSIINMNRLQDTVEHTDIVAECVTPGTRCFDLSRDREAARLNTITVQNKCLLVGATSISADRDIERILEDFDLCVEELLQH